MDLTIYVRDAASAPITGAEVLVKVPDIQRQGKSNGQGKFPGGTLPSNPFHVVVTHPDYLSEEVEVTPPAKGAPFLWDNPVCSVAMSGVITVHLSRLRASPTFSISDSELERHGPFNPQAVFTWTDHGGNKTGRYLGMSNNQESIVCISHPLLPNKPGEGWDRFNHDKEPVKIDPSKTGNLVWLEWGLGEKQPRLLVAAWVPRFRSASPRKLDFVIFFSPNTRPEAGYPPDQFPWLAPYPYSALKGGPIRKDGPPALAQPYPGLGHRYLFREKWLIYQMLAAQRQAIVLFPVQPSNDWGPFQEVSGLARLVAEVTHFLHRTAMTSGGNKSDEEDLAPQPRYRFYRNAVHDPLPPAQRIVLSGFSAGMSPIVRMLTTRYGQKLIDGRFNNTSLKSLFDADVAPFLNTWMEVWDHDAPNRAPDYTRTALDKFAPGWMSQNEQRILRCYQSGYTTPRDWIQSTPLAKFTPGSLKSPSSVGGRIALERHADTRCSLVYFDCGYLHHNATVPSVAPAFWMVGEKPNDPCGADHQAVPMVTFGHAASLSGLGRV
ncbi:carboxypeptidase regulatory-like domain-containing protein [Leptolyngbya sp. NK1-12]|uniref:Carboxypeptidase regulatory-like domain-containing protein n=1 Tax=Leptolyngbya sp. NK1-12 TaxID=2547451 RepID=A0AA96WEJ8_9CYAN|nr:carboxypeptidase-like regulatory domain-containing protein [Leptolyngbya sp. NK1-12]WNZ23120.1 carboxypeptidase regulatory-like domain-containing protein [Leptolyngbya sp. NK1-12]